MMLLIAWLSLLIWLVLLFGRGGFWRAQALERLSESTVHAVGQAEIARVAGGRRGRAGV
ncbi:MAG: Hopene-associated glycosyltransferase HpnB [uncultured Caballeronia sp.]|nr:MAG: Hopene-associated glycosyltransferase HpnB [uncultured Caballeronia sp.]